MESRQLRQRQRQRQRAKERETDRERYKDIEGEEEGGIGERRGVVERPDTRPVHSSCTARRYRWKLEALFS